MRFVFGAALLDVACAVARGGTHWALSRHGAQHVTRGTSGPEVPPYAVGRGSMHPSSILMPLTEQNGTGLEGMWDKVSRLDEFWSLRDES